MENDNKSELYIPYGVRVEKELFRGFSKRQIKHCAVGIACSFIIVTAIYIISRSIPITIISAFVGVAGSIMMTMKESQSNQSVVDIVINLMRFSKTQKRYLYVYQAEWGDKESELRKVSAK